MWRVPREAWGDFEHHGAVMPLDSTPSCADGARGCRAGLAPRLAAYPAAAAPAETVTSVRMYTCPIEPQTIEPVRHASQP